MVTGPILVFVGFTIFNLIGLILLGCAGYWLTVR